LTVSFAITMFRRGIHASTPPTIESTILAPESPRHGADHSGDPVIEGDSLGSETASSRAKVKSEANQ
jgi:hypothetical protein